jgi:hypothetical protein
MRLEEIDLTKGDGHEHPDFNTEDYFLVKKRWSSDVRPDYFFGKFNRQWYGWNFHCRFGVSGGFQYDKPGTNSSSWVAVWRMIEE